MTLKQKMKTCSFWISLVAALLIVLRLVFDKLNLNLDEALVKDITTGICGVLVILGILTPSNSKNAENEEDLQPSTDKTANKTANINKQSVDIEPEVEQVPVTSAQIAQEQAPAVTAKQEPTIVVEQAQEPVMQQQVANLQVEQTPVVALEQVNQPQAEEPSMAVVQEQVANMQEPQEQAPIIPVDQVAEPSAALQQPELPAEEIINRPLTYTQLIEQSQAVQKTDTLGHAETDTI